MTRTRFADDVLDGYDNVPLEKIHEISDNELSYIFCDLIIHNSTYDSYKKDIALWASKLRLGGTINIVGVDFRCVCSQYLYDNDLESMNKLISNSKCVITYKEVESALKELGLNIISININNNYFNITAKR